MINTKEETYSEYEVITLLKMTILRYASETPHVEKMSFINSIIKEQPTKTKE